MESRQENVLAVDIGGSSIKSAIVSINGNEAKIVERYDTVPIEERHFRHVELALFQVVEQHFIGNPFPASIAISTTGAVSRDGFVWSAGHFQGYKNIDWNIALRERFPEHTEFVHTSNDGKASTWAEYISHGSGDEAFVHFVVGTGVGGGIVCMDELLFGDEETAGGLGHMKVGVQNGLQCSCRKYGCVETGAAVPAIELDYAMKRPGDKRRLEFPDVVDLASNGDEAALEAISTAGDWLGVAVANVINVINPRVITIGGGVVEATERLSDDNQNGPFISAAIKTANKLGFEGVVEETKIRPARFGNDGGMLGASQLLVRRRNAAKIE